jgi:hypothetical protein
MVPPCLGYWDSIELPVPFRVKKKPKSPTTHMKTFDQTAREFVEVGLRSDKDRKISRIHRREPILYDQELVPIAWAQRNAAGS